MSNIVVNKFCVFYPKHCAHKISEILREPISNCVYSEILRAKFSSLTAGLRSLRQHRIPQLFVFQWTETKNDCVTTIMPFSCPSFPETNPKWLPVIVKFSISSGVVWTENVWCVLRSSKTSVVKNLWPSVNSVLSRCHDLIKWIWKNWIHTVKMEWKHVSH